MNTQQLKAFLVENQDKSYAWLAKKSGRSIDSLKVKCRSLGMTPGHKPKVKKFTADLERVLFIPDVHIPYHDVRAVDLMLSAMEDWKPDRVVIGGDFVDFYAVSSHDKNPMRRNRLADEISEAVDMMWRIKKLGATQHTYICGNHEDRLTRYLMQKAPELYDLLNIQSVLKLENLGFDFVPYKQHTQVGKLYTTHDTGKAGPNAHKQALDAFGHSVLINHTHRFGLIIQGDITGERRIGVMLGWLGDLNKVEYMHNINATKDWQLGFGLGYRDRKTDIVYVVPTPIINYTCMVEGKLYQG